MSSPCYYCELSRDTACKVCIHGEADADDLQAAENDAARYRYLRQHSYIELRCDSPRIDGWTPDKLDKAIDAVISEVPQLLR